MSRNAVGLLAAVGAAMSALTGLAHGPVQYVMVAVASIAAGLAAYGALPSSKRSRPERRIQSLLAVCAVQKISLRTL
jgi:hypothetical protein